ncbi:MAG: hypothetical protein WB496_25340 [Pseudolabrys sp.]
MSITFMNRISRVAIAARSMLLVAVIVLAVPVFAAPGEGLRGSVVCGDLGGLLGLPIEECRPNMLAGNRGWCNPSPYYVVGSAEQRQTRKRRARAQ